MKSVPAAIATESIPEQENTHSLSLRKLTSTPNLKKIPRQYLVKLIVQAHVI